MLSKLEVGKNIGIGGRELVISCMQCFHQAEPSPPAAPQVTHGLWDRGGWGYQSETERIHAASQLLSRQQVP